MKKIYVFFLVTLITLHVDFAKAINFPTVQEQLENLNKYWVGKDLNDPILKKRIPLTNDVSLIQMHLSFVEKTLRNKNCDNLTTAQKQNRQKSLDILHDYWVKGVFPKNIYHTKRTPYFIDKFGTACAVGQLLLSTGYEELAKKIMNENNNDYLIDLNLKYSEINDWANTFGFRAEELAWIQPCYSPVTGPGFPNVSCHGGSDGYFPPPTPSGGVAPYTLQFYKWYGTAWGVLWCGNSNLDAGYYKCTITDAVGVQQDYFDTITEPPPISQAISYTNDNGSCNGSATAVVSGGTPGYTYSWTPGGYTNDTISNLCANTYSLTITDNNGCIATDTVNISIATEIIDLNSSSKILLYPNPTNQNTTLEFDNSSQDICTLTIYDTQGRLVRTINGITADKSEIETNNLTSGLYFLQLRTDKKVIATSKLKIEQ
jgi:hypothetical protein